MDQRGMVIHQGEVYWVAFSGEGSGKEIAIFFIGVACFPVMLGRSGGEILCQPPTALLQLFVFLADLKVHATVLRTRSYLHIQGGVSSQKYRAVIARKELALFDDILLSQSQ